MTKQRTQDKGAKAPDKSQSDLAEMTVAQLRDKAHDLHISGVHDMRKDELVKAVTEAMGGGQRAPRPRREDEGGGGGVRTGKDSSDSLRYSQEVTSTDDEPERPGRSLVTTSHEVIQRWARERDAEPATVEGTEHGDHLGVLRFDFPGYGGQTLRRVSWDEWFATFDERGLNFIYQEERSDGSQSNFFRLENPDREDA
ncbi:Rho termination factor N-terminal domain-containing protein [Actinokineospora iranica]|uniref:Rho termination factor, N-terminal domain n=1 Tax=Actinokineospora iranica TaxID=1271860 RepID=A0A1G6JZ01_9PSEU|nr:Rho termination factor N-terminal domain-containing protein [Actinokineospora iranica]SDC23960.1 Rho termination factor, N-terminal domain [Actinokineospora iranica]